MTQLRVVEILAVVAFCVWQVRFLIRPSLLGLEIRSPMVFAIVLAVLGLWAAFAPNSDREIVITLFTLMPIAIMVGVLEWITIHFKKGPKARG